MPASTVMLILLLVVIVVAGVASWVKRKPLKVRRGEERGRRGEREKREGKRERRGKMAERIHPRWRAVPCVVPCVIPCVVYTNIGPSPVVFVYVFIPWCNSSFPSPHYSIVHRITSSYYIIVLQAWLLWKLSSASYKNMGSSVMEGGGDEGEEGAI